MKMGEKTKRKKGFVKAEWVVIVLAVCVLGAIAVPAMYGYLEETKAEVCDQYCRRLEEAFSRSFSYYYGTNYEKNYGMIMRNAMSDSHYSGTVTERDTYFVVSGVCPNNGTYIARLTKDHNIQVDCLKHGDMGKLESIVATKLAFEEYRTSVFVQEVKNITDYTFEYESNYTLYQVEDALRKKVLDGYKISSAYDLPFYWRPAFTRIGREDSAQKDSADTRVRLEQETGSTDGEIWVFFANSMDRFDNDQVSYKQLRDAYIVEIDNRYFRTTSKDNEGNLIPVSISTQSGEVFNTVSEFVRWIKGKGFEEFEP